MIKRELAVFLVVGTLTVLIDFLTYQALVKLCLINVDIAKGCSFLVGTAFAYFANRIWTFGHNQHVPGSVWRFVLLYTVTLGANVGINTLALQVLNQTAFAIQLAFILATGVSAFLNFLGMKCFVFKTRPVSDPI